MFFFYCDDFLHVRHRTSCDKKIYCFVTLKLKSYKENFFFRIFRYLLLFDYYYSIILKVEKALTGGDIKGMLNQRSNSDGDSVLPIERTYTHMIYATRTHYYILIHQHFTRLHT